MDLPVVPPEKCVIRTNIPDADVLILADPVDTVLALQAGGQIPAVGIVDDIMRCV